MSGRRQTDTALMHMVLEVQLYLADRYTLSAAETATVFSGALADSVAFALKPDVSAQEVEDAIEKVTRLMRTQVRLRLDHPPAMGLREMIAEYRHTGGTGRVS